MKKLIQNISIEGERPLYESQDVCLKHVTVLMGESALKCSRRIEAAHCDVQGMYVFWECEDVLCEDSVFALSARACSWYGRHHTYRRCQIDSPKMFRELTDLTVEDCPISNAAEFFWKCRGGELNRLQMTNAEYAFLHAENLKITHLQLQGKYIFQYARHIEIHHATLDTKDAFWESDDCTIYDSDLKGEYIGWYSRHLHLVRCRISGTQPLCYCQNLILEDCTFASDADRALEKSDYTIL